MKIDRQSTHALRTELERGSLLVIGDPGAGKTGTLHDVAVGLRNAGREVLFIVADRPQSEALAALKDELGLVHPIKDVLANWHGKEPAFLLTDALDAARSEYAASMLRELIEHALKLGGRWRVVASIRKFDLRYNGRLRSLFAGPTAHAFIDRDFSDTRHFSIPCLDDIELAELGKQSPKLGQLIQIAVSGGDRDSSQTHSDPIQHTSPG